MKQHNLKIWPAFFERVHSGQLTVQVRENDRNFREGDVLHLEEFIPLEKAQRDGSNEVTGRYTGLSVDRRINRMFDDIPGLQHGYVLLQLAPLVQQDPAR